MYMYIYHAQVQKCDICQRMTKKIKTGTPELHPVPVVSIWYHLGIDFMGPLTYKSKQGNTYIFSQFLIISVNLFKQFLVQTRKPPLFVKPFFRYEIKEAS